MISGGIRQVSTRIDVVSSSWTEINSNQIRHIAEKMLCTIAR